MKKELSKGQIKKEIENFFSIIKNKNPKEIKKAKKLAMKYKFPLKEKRKFFCKKCYSAYRNPKLKIKKGFKKIICENCGSQSRWKL